MIEREGKTIRIYPSKFKAGLIGLGSGLLSLAAIAALYKGHTDIPLWLGAFFFPLATVAMLIYIVAPKPILEMDESGLRINRGLFRKTQSVPWAQLEFVRLVRIQHVTYIGIVIAPAFADSYGRMAAFSLSSFGCHLVIPTNVMPEGAAEVLELIKAKWEAERA